MWLGRMGLGQGLEGQGWGLERGYRGRDVAWAGLTGSRDISFNWAGIWHGRVHIAG